MFSSEEFWLSAILGGAFGGILFDLFSKLLKKKKGETGREIGGADLNGSQKHPQEHDERFC